MYTSSWAQIRDLNTPRFWDKRMKNNESIASQDGMTQDRIKTAVKLLSTFPQKLVDIGAGMGYLEEVICHNKNFTLYANDFSKESVNHLRKRFQGNFTVQSLYKLQYKKNFFDSALILEVLEHVPPHKVFSILKSIKSILKKGGILIVSVPMNEGLEQMKENPNGHVRDYNQELLFFELEQAGFKVLEYKTFYAFESHYKIKKFLAKIYKNRWQPNNIIVKAILK